MTEPYLGSTATHADVGIRFARRRTRSAGRRGLSTYYATDGNCRTAGSRVSGAASTTFHALGHARIDEMRTAVWRKSWSTAQHGQRVLILTLGQRTPRLGWYSV